MHRQNKIKISKQTIAQTFKFDCDRFLRFQLSSDEEKENIGIQEITPGNVRPGVQLMQEAGNKWEIDKYDDLILAYGIDNVEHVRDTDIDERLGVKKFKVVKDLVAILNRENPPIAVIEAEFQIPASVSVELKEACDRFNIEPSKAIPDIIWIRPFASNSPLIEEDGDQDPEYELHVIDVKLAAEASLKHFTEVTFYALSLDRFLRENNLISKYRVSAKGLVWPGSHDANEFRNKVRTFESEGKPDPVLDALNDTLIPVPYEIYEVHVRRFLKDKLIPILETPPLEASWHVSSKCQLCQYLDFCSEMAANQKHLSMIPWLNKSQADLLRSEGITTTEELAENIETDSEIWQRIKSNNYQLKADELGLKARALAIKEDEVKIISERNTLMMPRFVNMRVFLTIHFDPGSGITFAMGAKSVYFKPNRTEDNSPIVREQVFIVDRVEQLNPNTERNRLVEFIDIVNEWLTEVHNDNEVIRAQRQANRERDSAFGKASAHVFFWSSIEVKQFKRMIERHMGHPDVVDRIELLIRLFPPDSVLPPDTGYYRSQPGTIVKGIIKQLAGLPIPYDYTLFETANSFFPRQKEDGTSFSFFNPYGFWTKLNDQIPFERAYEIWKDNVFLKHTSGRNYTRDEIVDVLKQSIKNYISALQHITDALGRNCGEQLKLKKPPFSAAPLRQKNIPDQSRKLVTFSKLNAITREIENLNKTALPVDEKEARFFSIRGMIDRTNQYTNEVNELLANDPELTENRIYVFEFSENSKDAKVKEGDFLCCISNESSEGSIYDYWYEVLGHSFYEALDILSQEQINKPEKKVRTKISDMFQVQILKLVTNNTPPYIIVKTSDYNADMFELGVRLGILNLDEPIVLDDVFIDFESADVEKVLRLIGGKASRKKKKR